jgi:uracil-DNA glycosylase family 4
MSLALDSRQRAMLQEMGVTVWSPELNAINNVAGMAIDTKLSANIESNSVRSGPHYSQSVQPPQTTHSADQQVPANAPSATSATTSVSTTASVPRPAVTQTKPAVAPQTIVAAPLPAGLDSMDWASLQQAAAACQACQLGSGRKNSVFGSLPGSQRADWLIVGDPPVEGDETEGAPFTGEAGQLLANMLKAMGLSVQQVVLTSATKCRTEGMSTGPHELAQCEAYLRRQVALTRPKMILAMGRYAAQALLAQTVGSPVPPLGQLRGVIHRYEVDGQGIPVVVTYSPTFLLRNMADKAKAWADLCLAKAALQTSL